MPDEGRCADVPVGWLEGKRTIVCIGETDTGKTTLVRSMLGEFRKRGERVFHVDLDMGQSTIGPPTTIGLKDPEGRVYLCFVGNTSPYGAIAGIREGLARLGRLLGRSGGHRVIVDTAGLVAGGFGWFLKRMEIAAMGADAVLVIDRSGESAHIVRGIREMGIECKVLCPWEEAKVRRPEERRLYRKRLFGEYFGAAGVRVLSIRNRDCSQVDSVAGAGPKPKAVEDEKTGETAPCESGQVVGLLDGRGFLVCLGLMKRMTKERLWLLVPRCDFRKVRSVRLGRYVYREE